MPSLRNPRSGPGPMGEETLFSDMHRERLRSVLSDQPDLAASIMFVLIESTDQVTAFTDSLAMEGMQAKEYDAGQGHGPERGKAIMESAWHMAAGGELALRLVQEKLDLDR